MRVIDLPDTSEKDMLQKLKKIDTPTITNVVATYQNSMQLYDAWFGEWYTDTSLKCMYPEYGPTVGYAATVVYATGTTRTKGIDRWALPDHLDATRKPIILVAKQDFPPELKNRVGLFGGNMTARFKAQGVAGIISDGPMRDLEEIREIGGVQYLVTGLTPGHGDIVVREVAVPVTVAGMTVMPGDMIHMDVHGACKFPAKHMAEILRRCDQLLENEKETQAKYGPDWSLEKWKAEVAHEAEK